MKNSNCINIAVVLLSLFCASCTKAQNKTTLADKVDSDKILIVYLSRTNNTKALAEIIRKQTGGAILALELEKPYPTDYRQTVEQVARENDAGFLPPLKTKVKDIDKYEVIFVGFPTWGMQLPPPIKSFLKTNNLQNKIIIPFNTNGGYGVGSSFDTLKSLCENSKVLKGFTVKGGIERDGVLFVMENEKKILVEKDVVKWLKEIEILK
ncbi:flavodoxin [Pedobacter aquatilis]|uniref:flavodoxin n=1 Tax=Pedobacter aquatilis TaxID=351343 RepID=UPI00292D9C06|nr:flavodoxin [Pedobacter aquatilis]